MKNTLFICLLGAAAVLTLLHGCQTTASQMSTADVLYRGKCSSCHNLIAPDKFDKDDWSKYVDEYGKKMTKDEKRILLDYLTADPNSPSHTERTCGKP